MCKYCDNGKTKPVLSYDNRDSMNICDGQYCGVKVYAELKMKGDILMLSGHGGYRSESDCYYESQGIDCDGEFSTVSKPSYIKIEYCPFCGRKLNSNTYKKVELNDKIKLLKDKTLYNLNTDLLYSSIVIYVTYEKSKPTMDEDVNGFTLDQIFEKFDKVRIHVFYPEDYKFNDWYLSSYETFKANEPIKYRGSKYNEHFSAKYILEDIEFEELVKRGLIAKDEEKWQNTKAQQNELRKKIDNVNSEICKLKDELESLNKK